MKRIAVQIKDGFVAGAYELNTDGAFGDPVHVTVIDYDTDGVDPDADDVHIIGGREVLVYEA